MDGYSEEIKDGIEDYDLKLTQAKVSNRFKTRSNIGCANHTSVPVASEDDSPVPCTHRRNHTEVES